MKWSVYADEAQTNGMRQRPACVKEGGQACSRMRAANGSRRTMLFLLPKTTETAE